MTVKEILKNDPRLEHRRIYTNDELQGMFFIAVDVDKREPIRRVLGSDNVSNNFKFYEIASKDGTAVILYSSLMVHAQEEKRKETGSTTVTSGFRSIPHNTAEKGHQDSWHTFGRAWDTKTGFTPIKQSQSMLKVVGSMWKRLVYSTFLHSDNGFIDK